MGKYTTLFDKRLKETRSKEYTREAYQSMLTSPEWMSVEISAALAKQLSENTTLFHVSYFKHVFELWRVLFYATYYSMRESGFFKTLLSDYMLMDIFVVVFTTFELLPKGLLSLLLYPFLSQKNDTEMQANFAAYYQDFASSLETTPFYQHDYEASIDMLSEQWAACENWTWTDYLTWSVVWMDLQSKRFISSFLKGAYDEDPTTQVLVKYNAVGITDKAEAIAAFKEKIAGIDTVTIVDNDVYEKDTPKHKNNQVYTSVYARINTPRYMGFKETTLALAEQGIYVRKIAGQDHVMLKCEVTATDKRERKAYQARVLNQVKGVTPLYEYNNEQDKGHALCLFKVPVKKLDKTIRRLEKESDDTAASSVNFIHNF